MKKIHIILAFLFIAVILLSCAPEATEDSFLAKLKWSSSSNNDYPEPPPPAYSSSSSSLRLSSSSVYNPELPPPSSSSKVSVVTGSFTDPRDGQSYGTVTIGSQTWMARNLNHDSNGSVCYDNQNSYCDTYGRLYDWATAKTACPNGWHLPSDAEWDRLYSYVDNTWDTATGGNWTVGKKLKATNDWNEGGNGTDDYGFAALGVLGYEARWWSASENDSDSYFWDMYGNSYAYGRSLIYNEDIGRWIIEDKLNLLSVRCLQD
jgi:uncharacterized protein (TIGR02145 family)